MLKIEDALRSKGLKVTPQRMAIWSMLVNTTSHPCAEDVYKNLLPTNPTISLATVYKTLESFKTLGLIQELSVGNGRSNYDANVSRHPHLVCNCCGRIDDFETDVDALLAPAIKQLCEETNYEIVNQQITFYGLCCECKAV